MTESIMSECDENGADKMVPQYSVIVPVYNSAATIDRLVSELTTAFETQIESSYELIFVDDGSKADATWQKLCEAADDNPHVSAVRLTRNFGKPAALLCGLGKARGSWIVTIDDDLQQRPSDIAKLIDFRAHDVVVATYRKKHHSFGFRLTSRVKRWFDRVILGLPMQMSPLKLIRRQTLDALLLSHSSRPYIPALLAHVTDDFHAVELEHQPSAVGKSRYSYAARIRQFSNLLISNSGFLLRAALMIGLLVCALAALGLLIFAVGWGAVLSHGSASQALTLISLVIGGMILICFGFVGEYLVRIVEQASGRPVFVVREEHCGAGLEKGQPDEQFVDRLPGDG